MAKATAKVEVDNEEAEFLAAEQARRQALASKGPQMKQLAINATDIVDANGKDITPATFFIRSEGVYSRTVTFRPLRYYSKFIKQVQADGKWKTDNESIYVENPFREYAYDMRGGIACGRLVGKVPSTWTETQRLENLRKAQWYGFLFGVVTLDGKETLVNFRIPQSKTKVVTDALSLLDKDMYWYNLTLKLVPQSGKPFPAMEVTPDLNNFNTSVKEVIPFIKEIDAFVTESNDRIMKLRERLEATIKANSAYKKVSNGSLEDSFNDTISF